MFVGKEIEITLSFEEINNLLFDYSKSKKFFDAHFLDLLKLND